MTGAPVAGARLALAGHGSGFGNELAATIGADGSHAIGDVPFHDVFP